MSPEARAIIEDAAAEYATTFEVIVSGGRKDRDTLARSRAAKRLRDELGYTPTEIAECMNKTHSAVLYWFGGIKGRTRLPTMTKLHWHKPRIFHLHCAGCYRCVPGREKRDVSAQLRREARRSKRITLRYERDSVAR